MTLSVVLQYESTHEKCAHVIDWIAKTPNHFPAAATPNYWCRGALFDAQTAPYRYAAAALSTDNHDRIQAPMHFCIFGDQRSRMQCRQIRTWAMYVDTQCDA